MCSTSVYVYVSVPSVPLWEITFPALCAHIFIAIRHDVISRGPEQSYLPGKSRPAALPVQRAPSPALLPTHACSASALLALITFRFVSWPLCAQQHAATRGNGDAAGPQSNRYRSVWVCCCYCIRMRTLRGSMLSRNINPVNR